MAERLASRPEARWALVAGIAGAIAAVALSVKGIHASASSTAAIGYIFVPFVAIAVAMPAAIWGLAAGCVWLHLRGTRTYIRAVLIMAWVVALAVPAAIGWEVWRGLALERAVHEAANMDAVQLDTAFDHGRWSRDRFYLGALAGNPAAGARLLDRIASLPDPELFEAMGSLWDVMGKNRKGLAVMRLVARHDNVGPATLEGLATGTSNEYVVSDVLGNAKTPIKVLERYFNSTEYLVEWGLALNPNTPVAVMERLSRSENLYTRMNLTYNRATPPDILRRLARDPDALLARNAKRALGRVAKGR